MMWDYGWGWGWPGPFPISLSSILWIVLIAAAIWALVRWLDKRNARTVPPASAMEILRQRYARGDIDTTTFMRMREQLEARAQAQEQYMQSQGPMTGAH